MEDKPISSINYTPINVANYQTSLPPVEPKKRRINIVNLALLLFTCTSLLGFAYAVRTAQTTVTTKASYNQMPDMTMMMVGTEIGNYKFPKTFKGSPIPDSLYKTAKVKDQNGKIYINDYIKEQIAKFYSYKYTLDENGIESSASSDVADFAILRNDVIGLQEILVNDLVTTYDFSYIVAHFSSNSFESKQKAKTIIDGYKSKLQDSENPESVVDEANNDAELTAINVTDKSQNIINHEITTLVFPADSNFNTFLTSQKEKIVSEPYILKDQQDVEVGYVILKVNAIHRKKYASLQQILEEQSSSFGY